MSLNTTKSSDPLLKLSLTLGAIARGGEKNKHGLSIMAMPSRNRE